MRKPLLALAVSAFGIGTSEFIIMGLLPDLAHSFQVSIPKTGILVSGYALSVTLGSPLVALALSRMDRKRALLILMGMFIGRKCLVRIGPHLSAASVRPHSHRALPWSFLRYRQHRSFSPGATLRASPGNCAHVQRADAGQCAWGSCRNRLRPGVRMAVRLLGVGSDWLDRRSWAMCAWCLPDRQRSMHLKHEFHAVLRPQVQLVLRSAHFRPFLCSVSSPTSPRFWNR